MSQAARVIETLKSLLKAQRKTYKEVAQELGLTEAGVKKALSSEALSLIRVESICSLLGLSLLDLVQLSKGNEGDKQLVLTYEQEEVLANDEGLFVVYYLILSRLESASIVSEFSFSKNKVLELVGKLEDLGLLSVSPAGHIKLKSALNPVWLDDGPLMKVYGPKLSSEFISDMDIKGGGYYRFLRGRIDANAVEVLKKKMQQIEEEFSLLCVPHGKGGAPSTMAFYHGIKPWKFSIIEKYRKCVPSPQEG